MRVVITAPTRLTHTFKGPQLCRAAYLFRSGNMGEFDGTGPVRGER